MGDAADEQHPIGVQSQLCASESLYLNVFIAKLKILGLKLHIFQGISHNFAVSFNLQPAWASHGIQKRSPKIRANCRGWIHRAQGNLSVYSDPLIYMSCPEVVLQPQNLEKLFLERFQAPGQSPEDAYKVLADILKIVDAQCQREAKELFLLIDRALRILVTSQLHIEEVDIEKRMKEGLMENWLDTTKPLPMHSSQYKGRIIKINTGVQDSFRLQIPVHPNDDWQKIQKLQRDIWEIRAELRGLRKIQLRSQQQLLGSKGGSGKRSCRDFGVGLATITLAFFLGKANMGTRILKQPRDIGSAHVPELLLLNNTGAGATLSSSVWLLAVITLSIIIALIIQYIP
ncbi:hypothetical protein BDZ45DRAFT_750284 [Acephala macrosclerotiorum]|nr:hypothetical protein BDZ45DRAFT_750284 [Acephala macrosclerotiorum]